MSAKATMVGSKLMLWLCVNAFQRADTVLSRIPPPSIGSAVDFEPDFHAPQMGPKRFLLISSPSEKKIVWTLLKNFESAEGRAFPLVDNGLDEPRGMAFDHNRGHLYIADSGAKKIFRYTVLADREAETLTTTGLRLTITQGHPVEHVTIDAHGNLFYTAPDTKNINKINRRVIDKIAKGEIQPGNLVIISEKVLEFQQAAQTSIEEAKKRRTNHTNNASNTHNSSSAGADNSGADNSGADNSGADNSGADNSGSDNSGADNSGADNNGAEANDDTSSNDTSSEEDALPDALPTDAPETPPHIFSVYEAAINDHVTSPASIWASGEDLYWTNLENGTNSGTVVKGKVNPKIEFTETGPSPFPATAVTNVSDGAFALCKSKKVMFFTRNGSIPGSGLVTGLLEDANIVIDFVRKINKPRGLAWDMDQTMFVADEGFGAVWSFPAGRFMKDVPLTKAVSMKGAFGLVILSSSDPAFNHNQADMEDHARGPSAAKVLQDAQKQQQAAVSFLQADITKATSATSGFLSFLVGFMSR